MLHGRRLGEVVASMVVLTGFLVGTSACTPVIVTLERAPYVTDLSTSSAYVNWGTNSTTPGSVLVVPKTGSSCGAMAWSSSSIAAGTSIPLNKGSSTTTGWGYTVEGTAEYQNSVPVTGLAASTSYCYAVFSGHTSGSVQLGTSQSFETLDPVGSTAPLTFDIVADTGENGSGFNQGQANIYSEIGNSGARFLVIGGDVGYSDGSQNNYGDLTHTGSEVSNIFGPGYLPAANGIPTFVADGNHGQNANDLTIFPEPFSATSSGGAYHFDPQPTNIDNVGTTVSYPQDWYAVQSGNTRIYMLDASFNDGQSFLNSTTATGSLCGPVGSVSAGYCEGYQLDGDQHWQTNSAEYQWLQTDLAAHPGGVKMAVFHYPAQSDNSTQPSDPYLAPMTSLLSQNGVQVAFDGHAHTYQRWVSKTGGLSTFVSGGGGGTLEPIQGGSACSAIQTNWNFMALGWSSSLASQGKPQIVCGTSTVPTSTLQVYNYLQVTVVGTQVTVNAYNANNQLFDTQSFSYGSPPPPTTSAP